MSGYTREIIYIFEAGGEHWAVTEYGNDYMLFEETRKNGQEDTHMSGQANLEDGVWKLDDCRNTIATYSSESTPDAIEAFFNEHGLPVDPDYEVLRRINDAAENIDDTDAFITFVIESVIGYD